MMLSSSVYDSVGNVIDMQEHAGDGVKGRL
jgi:hypothetical protein